MAGGAEKIFRVGRNAGEAVYDDVFAEDLVDLAGVVVRRDGDPNPGAVRYCGRGHPRPAYSTLVEVTAGVSFAFVVSFGQAPSALPGVLVRWVGGFVADVADVIVRWRFRAGRGCVGGVHGVGLVKRRV